jgi:hypothetical protein
VNASTGLDYMGVVARDSVHPKGHGGALDHDESRNQNEMRAPAASYALPGSSLATATQRAVKSCDGSMWLAAPDHGGVA